MEDNKKEYINRLLNIDKKLICINNLMESLISNIEQMDEILTGEILDELGVPKDNSCEMFRKYGSEWPLNNEAFCRDWYYDLFYKFTSSEITSDEFIKKCKIQKNKTA